MPYSHFHNWSFHTHHRRPKGGRHHNAVRRRQRPWRIAFLLISVFSSVLGAAWFGLMSEVQRETTTAIIFGIVDDTALRREVQEQKQEKDGIETTILPAATVSTVAIATQTPVPLVARTDTSPSATAPAAAFRRATSAPTRAPKPTYTPRPTHTVRLTTTTPPTPTATATPTPRPTSTPRPTPTPRPTRTPTQIPGRADLYSLHPLPQGLAYIWWYWEDDAHGFQSIDFDFIIHNDIGATDLPSDSGLYLILFMSDISGIGYYFGLQTDVYDPRVGRGRGKGLIFSRWDTRDLANVRVAEDGWSQSAGYEGDFVGVRKSYNWGAGDYRVRIAADGQDDNGRWFGLWITDKATSETTWCGSIRFDKFASLEPSGGTAPEIYGAGASMPIDVPLWHISVQQPIGNENSVAKQVYIDYNNFIPNSNVIPDLKSGTMDIYVGGATERTTKEGWVDLE